MKHLIFGHDLTATPPNGFHSLYFGMGCFWGAERIFWQIPGIYSTAVGYAGGDLPNPSYERVCRGDSGHFEAVRVTYNPQQLDLDLLLKAFWESHDPTKLNRQGNDIGTQYRSAILVETENQLTQTLNSMDSYQQQLNNHNKGKITTEIKFLDHFYLAEDYHQQYLYRNPNGYCGLQGTGISCQI